MERGLQAMRALLTCIDKTMITIDAKCGHGLQVTLLLGVAFSSGSALSKGASLAQVWMDACSGSMGAHLNCVAIHACCIETAICALERHACDHVLLSGFASEGLLAYRDVCIGCPSLVVQW
jgi:hypothetical protein